MVLSDAEVEAIHFKEFGYVATGLGQFARAIEAEVRKDDEALILRMLTALERCRFDSLNMTIKDMQDCSSAVTAAHARLEGKT